jgi:hypothetical protein
LDDDERDALARHLDGMGVAELVRCAASPHAGKQCDVAELFSGGGLGPGAAAGRSGEHAEQWTHWQLDADVQSVL